ncbi:MAG: hypothetical protein PHR66_10130 [Desulfuromonadaceae bacterium]|nr:hypothetical protein [Desulfuromonadaceae bacterium]
MNALRFLQNGRTFRVKTGDSVKDPKRPFVLNLFHKPKTEKEIIMKNLIKITAVSSLLIAACFLISACGGESFVQGKGKVDIYVTDLNTSSKLQNVNIEVRENNAQGNVVATILNATDANGFYQWESPTAGVASDYYFTFSLAGYVTQSATATPNLTGTNVTLNIKLAPAP